MSSPIAPQPRAGALAGSGSGGPQWRRIGLQIAAYALFFGLIGGFSNAPAYRHLDAGRATVTLSIRHAGQRLGDCKPLAAAELARLPAGAQAPPDCPRQRSPLWLELDVNGKASLRQTVEARGIHGDGMASTYRRLEVPAGRVELEVRMKDHPDQTEFPYHAHRSLQLSPAEVLVIEFDPESRRFGFGDHAEADHDADDHAEGDHAP